MNYDQLARIMEANNISADKLAKIAQDYFSYQIDLELCGIELGLGSDKEKIDRYHGIIDDLREELSHG